ncbi:MAG TPA: hypothetical protein VNF05_04685 [Acidimicrobiales bacterium]|nr:hypothetical protein [Acidimicrobiales bacterium]
MHSTKDRVNDFYRRLPPWAIPVLLIVLTVLLGNAVYVLGLGNNDPISWTAGISQHLCRLVCSRQAIDPNVGFITQSLGHQAAMDLLHGHIPWWNYFEGLGQPLAGEMQSAALFPLTLLFGLSSGLVWFHVSLEVIAGISTYFLARRLSLPIFMATVAGMLFALNGTYAWLGNAVLNPVAFLPMLILGIEMIVDSAPSTSKRGWYIAAIALALSMYAGFPEVAYFDGLFAGVWAIVRLFSVARAQRVRVLRRLGLGGLVGIVLSLPILVPFYDFMKVAFVGGHTAAVDGVVRLPTEAISAFFDPYVFGTIFNSTNVNSVWGEIGGYFGASICALALVGLFGSRLRPLRIFLVVWTFVGLAGALNIFHLRVLWNLIPLVSTSSFPRYIMPSCELAVVILAGLGLADFTQSTRAKRLLTSATVLMVLVLLWCANEARPYNKGVILSHKARIILIGLDLIPFIALAALLVVGRFYKARVTPLLIALVVVGESLLLFIVPTVGSPKEINVDYAPIHFLQQNEHQYRFVDFAVLYPNWGTEFGLNSLSSIDLPYPRNFKNFIEQHLYPGLTPGNQFVIKGGLQGVENQEAEIVQHFQAYENASVKYLLIPIQVVLSPALTKLGVKKVFSGTLASVYELPHPRGLFSTSSSSCTVTSTNDNVANVDCTKPGATLLRTELSMSGWKATVNGTPATITTIDGVYQQVNLPTGQSVVEYSFFPSHERYALLAGLLAGLFLIGSFVNERVGFIGRRGRHRS